MSPFRRNHAPPPAEVRRGDRIFLGVLVLTGMVETSLRSDLSWDDPTLWACVALMPTVLWRRSKPLLMIVLAMSVASVVRGCQLLTGRDVSDVYVAVFLLVLPYAAFRWGGGRQAIVGLVVMVLSHSLDLALGMPWTDLFGGIAVLSAAAATGAAMRYRERGRIQELEQVKLREREQLARELHDTVAHHVSAIAIQAQAGRVTAPHGPESAVEALRVIEAEASRALTEMRAMVRALRREGGIELTPTPGIEELERLSLASVGGPEVVVENQAPSGLSPSISAAIYRIAQEAITNARRHARNATRIHVGLTADERTVVLRVADNGGPSAGRVPVNVGYGLTGMIERAELLGGTCHAGPDAEGGWSVTAVLPRQGPTS